VSPAGGGNSSLSFQGSPYFFRCETAVAPSLDDIVKETRTTYQGPLEVGEDLMSFDLGGDDIAVKRPVH
jgi:hypothetical protein